MIYPRAYTHQDQFAAAVAEVERQFHSKGVVRITFEVREDWYGDLAVYFKVLLTDAAVQREGLHAIAKQVSRAIVEQIDPQAEWGVYPFFNYRTQAVQAQYNDPAWA